MVDEKLKEKILDVSSLTPDPKRAERNLIRFFEKDTKPEKFLYNLEEIATLFAYSQFLANYCIQNPVSLEEALKRLKLAATKERINQEIEKIFPQVRELNMEVFMKKLRKFKKDILLWITLRDILGKADIFESMEELTNLSEMILEYALEFSLIKCIEKYGQPPKEGLSIIGLGKLGGEELNYSSDIDIIGVYDADPSATTSGVLSPTGVRYNRISTHQFFCKVMETLGLILTQQTEDGFVYRVDMRLRPQGQRGELVLPIEGYRDYYETWGRTWERMVLIRARPVAGDRSIAERFMEILTPFVWQRPVDYTEIEEIRTMKKKIDSTFTKDDIKRGFGGIREAEFFVQTLQLMYAKENRSLRTHRLFNAIQVLRWMGLIPSDDLALLWENYLYLRRLEHYLQMKDDLQTHRIPSEPGELKALAKKMKFRDSEEFLTDLRIRRRQIKSMYNSLLGTEEDIYAEAMTILMGELNDEELKGYLSFRGIKDLNSGLRSLKGLQQQLTSFRTEKERALMRRIVPLFWEEALRSVNPDDAVMFVEKFFNTFGSKAVFLSWFHDQPLFIKGIVRIFALSTYLTRLFLSDQTYLSLLIEDPSIRKSLKSIREQLDRFCLQNRELQTLLAEYRGTEEFRLGLFFLMDILSLEDLTRYITNLAEAIIAKAVQQSGAENRLMVIGMGKLGGREMNFGSDIDLLFVVEKEDDPRGAEKVMKLLTSYTEKGPPYRVDMRLRPDGSKGTLSKTLEGYKGYYLKRAQPWEVQALIKARPISGLPEQRKSFMKTLWSVFEKRSQEVSYSYIRQMRERIIREVSHEKEGIDIKFGPGGIEEIEFFVQWLQISNLTTNPSLWVQNTEVAIGRLTKAGILPPDTASELLNAYQYLRKLEIILRLNEESVIKEASKTRIIARFMGHRDEKELLERINSIRQKVLTIIDNNGV
jgi:glutamate-ammonia-ligase adenylyltransferase